MLKGNKGEWSEVYALLKIISDKKLTAGDKDLKKISSLVFPIIKILRDEADSSFEYSFDRDLVLIKSNHEEYRIPISEFQKFSKLLLSKLKDKTDTTFSIPEIESFIHSFKSKSLKAKSSVKSDIRIIIHDLRTGTTPELGFSIKSQLGGASTLLNASKSTNFLFKIENLSISESEINSINNINSSSKIKDRIDKINKLGGSLRFLSTESNIFGNNLILIDSSLPQIIAETLKIFFTSPYSKCSELINKISDINPLGFDTSNNHPYYIYKFKRFLTDVALGMMPSKVWEGNLDATGGYLIIKDDGDVLCYHIYNRNEFEDYLYYNTKFETASSTRHEFGNIYKEKDNLYFKLNLQIRFI